MAMDLDFERWITVAALGLVGVAGAQTINPGTGGGGGATTPATTQIYKGNGSTNGVVAATPCTDFITTNCAASLAALQSTSLTTGFISSAVTNPTTGVPQGGNARAAASIQGTCALMQAGGYPGCVGLNIYPVITAPGFDNGGNNGTSATGWSISNGIEVHTENYQMGIGGGMGIYNNKYATGDQPNLGIYAAAYGGQTQQADEGLIGIEDHVYQLPWMSGTITGGAATGSNLVTVGITANSSGTGSINPGGFLLNTKTASFTATLASNPIVDSTLKGVYYNLSGGSVASPVSSAYGTIIPGTCTPNGNGQGQTTATTSCSVTLGSGSGNFVASANSQLACAVGVEMEHFFISSVGTTSGGVQTGVSFPTKYAWNGAPSMIAQNGSGGGLCGQGFIDTSALTTMPVAYMEIGATSATNMYFGECRQGTCNAWVAASNNMLLSGKSITSYPMAEIRGINAGTTNQAGIGIQTPATQAVLGPNTIPFASNDPVIGAAASEIGLLGMRVLAIANSPSLCTDLTFGCAERVGVEINDNGAYPLEAGIQMGNNQPFTRPSLASIYTAGTYTNALNMNILPTDAIIVQHGNLATGSTQTALNLFHYNQGATNTYLSMNLANQTLSWTNPFVAQTVSALSLAATNGPITSLYSTITSTPYSPTIAFIADSASGALFKGAGYGSSQQGSYMGQFNCQFDFSNNYLCGIDNSNGAAAPGLASNGITDPGAMLLVGAASVQSPQSTLASASTIAFTTPAVVLTGTAAIATVTAPYGAVRSSGTLNTTCSDILATGAWTTTTAGNIQGAMTAVANTMYRWCYWPVISKWTIK